MENDGKCWLLPSPTICYLRTSLPVLETKMDTSRTAWVPSEVSLPVFNA